MEKLYRVTLYGRDRIYRNRHTARSAFSNMRDGDPGQFYEANVNWIMTENLLRGQQASWQNKDIQRAHRLRQRAQALLMEADRLSPHEYLP